NRTENKIPILGDAPLIGKLFRNQTLNSQRNELVITVTPHLVPQGSVDESALASPAPRALPTLPPGTEVPPMRAQPFVPSGFVTPAPPGAPATRTPAAAVTQTPAPKPTTAAVVPNVLPTAFGQTNVFTFGQAPQNNYAKANDPVQIFFAQVSPTVLKSGQPISVAVITTSNVSKLTFGYGTFVTEIPQTSPGQFSATFPFSPAGVPFGQSQVQFTLKAQRADGQLASIPVPISVAN
ncbi:MAG: hypothetical protein JO164_13095, partial [Candidatus Eremiobacteraeota bacterium]|nr:hypothetical protein [Candidatus Eremiobacteraeota bacterium]